MISELDQKLLDAADKLHALSKENTELMNKLKAKAATKEIGPNGEFVDKKFGNGIKEVIVDVKNLLKEIDGIMPL